MSSSNNDEFEPDFSYSSDSSDSSYRPSKKASSGKSKEDKDTPARDLRSKKKQGNVSHQDGNDSSSKLGENKREADSIASAPRSNEISVEKPGGEDNAGTDRPATGDSFMELVGGVGNLPVKREHDIGREGNQGTPAKQNRIVIIKEEVPEDQPTDIVPRSLNLSDEAGALKQANEYIQRLNKSLTEVHEKKRRVEDEKRRVEDEKRTLEDELNFYRNAFFEKYGELPKRKES
uniref:Uncharacterized protein n=1 Tax=Ditylenchus dipsaci TaxID=166011 RepID=A0A915CQL7_9BILA